MLIKHDRQTSPAGSLKKRELCMQHKKKQIKTSNRS